MWSFVRIPLITVAFVLSGVTMAAAQESPAGGSRVPGGENLLDWLGLEQGDTLAFVDVRGETVCAWVGEKRRLDGSLWAPLQGLPWPGLATDSQILLPLDGSLGVGVIRTPGPRPRVDDLLEAADSVRFLPNLTPRQSLARPLEDGWYAFGGSPGDPAALLYVWCALCMDAKTTVWLEKGRGIVEIESMTIAGGERLTRISETESCRTPDAEFQIYVAPAGPRDP
ncbi:MAG: hypothetical protein H0W36_02075 [Gemmatimonadetes bacterium]|nr:hypothetical protein [Gemmatimonadota bacterium]